MQHHNDARGSGSAENKSPNAIAGLKDLGARSGRDDVASGSNDGMEAESMGEATDR